METNSSLINFEELKEFIIQNKIKQMKKNTRQKEEKNKHLFEFENGI